MERLLIISAVAVIALLVSAIADIKKTWQGIKRGIKMLLNILPSFLTVILLVSIFINLLPEKVLIKHLGENSGVTGMLLAAMLGSIALIPGFIAFPLGALLLHNGVSYKIISIFITTLMMVGVLTLPVEIKYFGTKVAVMRNALSFIGALVIGIIMGFLL